MIGMLKGTVEGLNGSSAIIDVNGVGYKVLISTSTASYLQETSGVVKIYTYPHIREDIFELYGFQNQDDLYLFEMIISVNGVGPKTALGIFSLGKGQEIRSAIVAGNADFFIGVPRLGKKNAQKIILELKNKLGSLEEFEMMPGDGVNRTEVVAALKMFGFTVGEINEALKTLNGKGETVEEKVKLALKYLGK